MGSVFVLAIATLYLCMSRSTLSPQYFTTGHQPVFSEYPYTSSFSSQECFLVTPFCYRWQHKSCYCGMISKMFNPQSVNKIWSVMTWFEYSSQWQLPITFWINKSSQPFFFLHHWMTLFLASSCQFVWFSCIKVLLTGPYYQVIHNKNSRKIALFSSALHKECSFG